MAFIFLIASGIKIFLISSKLTEDILEAIEYDKLFFEFRFLILPLKFIVLLSIAIAKLFTAKSAIVPFASPLKLIDSGKYFKSFRKKHNVVFA